jgi:hypothetical protein
MVRTGELDLLVRRQQKTRLNIDVQFFSFLHGDEKTEKLMECSPVGNDFFVFYFSYRKIISDGEK